MENYLDDQPNGHLNHNWGGITDKFALQENVEDGMRIASEDSIHSIINNELGVYKGHNGDWRVWSEKNAWLWTSDLRKRSYLSTLRASRRLFNICIE